MDRLVIKGFIFDIDGTLVRGNDLLPGAPQVLGELRRRELAFVLLTNDSQETPHMWAERLAAAGLEIDPETIITAALVAADVTAKRFPRGKILAVGDSPLTEAIRARGLSVLEPDSHEQADVVVMGMDSTFDQRRLDRVCQQIWGGAAFLATNDDRRRPAACGYVPGTGALVRAVEWVTEVKAVVVGKPAVTAASVALERIGLSAAHVAMVGDRPETDIAMGNAVGMKTVLVSSESTAGMDPMTLPSAQRPDRVLANLKDLLAWFEEVRQ